MALNCASFINFLQELQFNLPCDSKQLYPRVPASLRVEVVQDLCAKIAHYSRFDTQ